MPFFVAIRKHKKLRLQSSAVARDPDGNSRIPKETFAQVFERMEKELAGKKFDFSTVAEYFTKRGRPMTLAEIAEYQEEDR